MQFRSPVAAIPAADHGVFSAYREYIRVILNSHDVANPEAALAFDPLTLRDALAATGNFRGHSQVLLCGIGGSSLGVEAVHDALGGEVSLHVIDAISPAKIQSVCARLQKANASLEDFVVVITSKSGSTTETIANAALLLSQLTLAYGEGIKTRIIVITDRDTPLDLHAREQGYTVVTIPHAVGGRFSVFTAVGLVPLALLGHDVDALLRGAEDQALIEMEGELPPSFIAAHLLARASERLITIYDTFVFDTGLRAYSLWRRQLVGESLGKSKALDGRVGKFGPVPTVSTLVDLHSVGQLYLGGFRGIHTDFISLTNYEISSQIPDTPIAALVPHISGASTTEITHAIYKGVTLSYVECHIPFNEYVLPEKTAYELGALMVFNMLETMYAAELLGIDAFDQPNVELYKKKTREALT